MIERYQSPFSVRYGSDAMRELWSERRKRMLWRHLWAALADVQADLGIVSREQAADIAAHAGDVSEESVARALAIEHEIRHDLMAEVRAFAEQCPVGGGVIHLGATSMDIEDNADALRLRDALDLTLAAVHELARALAAQVERYADLPTMAWTHIQPAEPTTVGYRLAQYLQDLHIDLGQLTAARDGIRGKGFKGAVGTSASYGELVADPAALEAQLGEKLGLAFFDAATQTYPRKQDWLVVNALAGLAQTVYKFAFDLRLLQTPPIGEWSEPFGAKQVGSSAMPFKRNPINAEKIDSLARYLATLPRVMWDNAAHSLLERTLDDSANRRVVLAEAFLAADEITHTTTRIVRDLRVNEVAVRRNMRIYGPFAATERLLMATVKRGADRQHMHEIIREHSLAAWAALQNGEANPLIDALCADPRILQFIPAADARALLDADAYVGDAPQRARRIAGK